MSQVAKSTGFWVFIRGYLVQKVTIVSVIK